MDNEAIRSYLYALNSELGVALQNHQGARSDIRGTAANIFGPKEARNENLLTVAKVFFDYGRSLGDDLQSLEELKSVLFNIRSKFILLTFWRPKSQSKPPNLHAFSVILERVLANTRAETTDLLRFVSRINASSEELGSLLFDSIQDTLRKVNKSLQSLERIQSLLADLVSQDSTTVIELPTQSWHFIENQELRTILDRDYWELSMLLRAKVPKSALVMCGSILEAVLVDVLRKRESEAAVKFSQMFPKQGPPPLYQWSLNQLISVAAGLGILDTDTERHADLLREYRNLIHPMLEVRRGSNIDDEIVTAHVAMLKRILRLLSNP